MSNSQLMPMVSRTTTLAPSTPVSRAASDVDLKKTAQLDEIQLQSLIPDEKCTSISSQKSDDVDPAPVKVVLLCLFLSLTGLLFGWEGGIMAGIINIPDYQIRFGQIDLESPTYYSIPSNRLSLLTSFMGLGGFIGSLGAGPISSRLGIRVAVLVGLMAFMTGVTVQATSMTNWAQLLAGRLISGLGVGSLTMLAPLFQAECSPKHLRGMISSTFQFCCTFGIFFVNVVYWRMHNQVLGSGWEWRIGMVIQACVAFCLFAGVWFMPESPGYYIKRGMYAQAQESLARLRGVDLANGTNDRIEKELAEMKNKAESQSGSGGGYLECFRSKDRIRLRTMIAIMVQAGQQWTGVNFFFSYGVKFFVSAGISNAYLTQVILSGVNVVSTLPGLYMVEHWGRRPTLLFGSVVMLIGQVVAGALGSAFPNSESAGKALITFTCIFIAAFASTWGPLGFVVAAESIGLSPSAPYLVSLATMSNWGNNFLLAMITPYIMDSGYGALGAKITFVWAGALLLFGIFTFFVIPETAGLSLGEVEELYADRVAPWRSGSWKPKNKRQVRV